MQNDSRRMRTSGVWLGCPGVGRVTGGILLGLALLVMTVGSSWGIGGLTCVSNDNHLYFILRGNVADKGTQITTVVLSSGTASNCNEAPPSDGILTSFSSGIQGFGASSALLPNRMRTTVINGKANSSLSCNDFDPTGNGGEGVLNLPSGGTVSVAGGTIPLVDVHTSDSAVPA